MADEIEDDKIIEQEVVEPVSARDEINNDVVNAIASLKGEPEVPEAKEPEAKDLVRGPDGKFAPKEATPAVAAADPKLPPAEDVAKVNEQPSTVAAVPPVSWAADAKQAWASIPPAVQQAVLKREQEASNGIRQYSEKTARYEQALAPVAQAAQARGMSVDDGIKRLIDGNTFLETKPVEAIMWLAQKNGIDLAELASNPPQQVRAEERGPQVVQTDPVLVQRLQQVEFRQNYSIAQQFAASKPHYAMVEEHLPAAIVEVRTLDPTLDGFDLLEKAYERAIWLNPDIRSQVTAAENAKTAQTQVAKVQEKSSQASRAAVSVKGSSAGAPAPRRAESNGSAFDDVRAAIQQLKAG